MKQKENTARVIITTECNFKCEYCCNKIPEIQDSFKMGTFDEFVKLDYRDINISGGEPTLVATKLDRLIKQLRRKPTRSNIFLYTNGHEAANAAYKFGSRIDGVNIGCHDNIPYAVQAAVIWSTQNPNVRFYIQEGRLTETVKRELQDHGISIKEWKMNDCDNTPEDRWII